MGSKKQWFIGIPVLAAILFLSTIGLKYALDDGSRHRNATSTDTHKKESGTQDSSDNNTIKKDNSAASSFSILLDPGHGGKDPGKIGVHDEREKDINLSIALKVRDALTAAGFTVTMTRETDTGLYSETDSNKKIKDLMKRCELAKASAPTLFVSIHQNSYPSSDIAGAQVFYYSGSEQGKIAAETLQKTLIALADPANTRQAKANDDYYLLKHCACPAVIIECGFLSNEAESAKLSSEDYQNTLTKAIVSGITEYCNGLQ